MPTSNPPLASKQQAIKLAQNQHFHEAQVICKQVCEQTPDDSEAWFLLAAISGQLGDFKAAENSCRRAIKLQPGNAMLHYNLGITLLNQQKLEESIASFESAIQLNPHSAEAYHDMGNAQQTQGALKAAVKNYKRAIQLQPALFSAHYNLGSAYQKLEQPAEAITCYEKALKLRPDFRQALNELATLHFKQQQYDRVIKILEPISKHLATDTGLNTMLAAAHLELGHTQAAQQTFNQILDTDPGHIGANYGFARLLRTQGQLTAAIEHLQTVLDAKPAHAEALAVFGGIKKDQGKVDEGIEAFRKALSLEPERSDFRSSFLLNLNYTDSLSPEEQFSEHYQWGKLFSQQQADKLPLNNSQENDRPLRIGYVSPDFRVHSVSYFFEPLLINHDRSRFKCYCYADLRLHNADSTTARLKNNADSWCDISGLGDIEAAKRIQMDGIDILVDLAGHTAGSRPGIFACKPAPIQVSYLGYPNTTGLAEIDYRLTDHWSDPEAITDQFYTESLVRLANGFLCYQPPQEAPDPFPAPFKSTGYVTFGSFNNLAKVTPTVIKTWGGILNSIPDARLVMKNGTFRDVPTQDYYHSLFEQQGIDKARISLLPGVASLEKHLATYATIDIALDTFPYNGTTTSCEALWMGVPVITLMGQVHASRVGLSLLSQTGLGNFVAESTQAYVAIATNLANNTDALLQLREGLRDRIRNSSLCNVKETTRSVESFYKKAWKDFCRQP